MHIHNNLQFYGDVHELRQPGVEIKQTLFWNNAESEYKYYELKKVRGVFTFVDGLRYFTVNDSLIHLKLDNQPIKACGQEHGTASATHLLPRVAELGLNPLWTLLARAARMHN